MYCCDLIFEEYLQPILIENSFDYSIMRCTFYFFKAEYRSR